MTAPLELRVISLRSVTTRGGMSCDWHEHRFEEFCLTTEDSTVTGQAGRRVPSPDNSLFYYARGVSHGYWNSPRQSPRFWVLHFTAGTRLKAELSFLRRTREAHWRLTPAQAAVFKDIFLKLFFEHSRPSPWSVAVEAAWLRLLLVEVQRWVETQGNGAGPLPSGGGNPELMRLWQLVNECVPQPGQLMRRLRADVPNYDSLRHSFRSVFGCSPRQLLLNLRMEQAKNLLLETPLMIKEVAAQVGYPQQDEFARAFRRLIGVSPTRWREQPMMSENRGSADKGGRGRGMPR
jgi:AraC-like DNA-binding protein